MPAFAMTVGVICHCKRGRKDLLVVHKAERKQRKWLQRLTLTPKPPGAGKAAELCDDPIAVVVDALQYLF